jgi:CRISPR-associated protein Csb1
MALTLKQLTNAVSDTTAAFRCRQRLQPGGGEGDKVFPPTYAGAVYAIEERRVKDANGKWQTLPCVLMDSVQSQANRMEEALQLAIDTGRFDDCPIPLIEVDFSGAELLDDIQRVTSLQAPHRVADAILRDSLLDGVPFRESEIGQRLALVSLQNATALYEVCPTALIFGMWDSTGPKGGLGAKFQRAIVSEIVGVNVSLGVRTASRLDPLIKVTQGMNVEGRRLSEVNLGNITPDVARYDAKAITKENRLTPDPMRSDGGFIEAGRIRPGGVTLDYAGQTTVISLPALRRLRFPLDGAKPNKDVDAAGRTVLLALGLCAAALAAERGFDLRSRCLLFPEAALEWEIVASPGKMPETITIDADSAIALLKNAVEAAENLGLTWRKEPLVLRPRPELIALVRRSQELAASQPPAASQP